MSAPVAAAAPARPAGPPSIAPASPPAASPTSPPASVAGGPAPPAGARAPTGLPDTPFPGSTFNPPLALDGYCSVNLLDTQKWIAGDRRWGAVHRGRTYLFVGPDEQRRFLSDPDRFAPVLSGDDVVAAVERQETLSGSRAHGGFYRSHVYLFANEDNLQKFARDPDRYIQAIVQAFHSTTNFR
jgi:YHS domain-containing protein